VITGELGENDCTHGFIDTAMNWMDQHGVNYLGWAWITANCGNFPSLITSYDGTPTQFGIGYETTCGPWELEAHPHRRGHPNSPLKMVGLMG